MVSIRQGGALGGLPASLVPLCERQAAYVIDCFPATGGTTSALGTMTPLMGQSCVGEAEVVHHSRGSAGNHMSGSDRVMQ